MKIKLLYKALKVVFLNKKKKTTNHELWLTYNILMSCVKELMQFGHSVSA